MATIIEQDEVITCKLEMLYPSRWRSSWAADAKEITLRTRVSLVMTLVL